MSTAAESAAEPVSPYVRADLQHVKYKPVETIESIASELGLGDAGVLLKIDANENTYGTVAAVRAAAEACPPLHVYPDPGALRLREAAAEFATEQVAYQHRKRVLPPIQLRSAPRRVDVDNVVVGAGSDDILEILVRMHGSTHVVTMTPTFGMYAFLGKLYGATVADVPRDKNRSFAVDVDAVVARVGDIIKQDASARPIVFLTTPNNPTGTVTPLAEIETIAKGTAGKALLVVDEAYIEFVLDETPTAASVLTSHDNLVVVRTMSKWAGLAGVRSGYALTGNTALVRTMLSTRQPYHLTLPSNAASVAAFAHADEIMKSVVRLSAAAKELRAALADDEFSEFLSVIPGSANLILVEVLDRPAQTLFSQLRKMGVLVRYFGSQGGDLHSHIRISSPKQEDVGRVVRALRCARDGGPAMAAERVGLHVASHRPQAVLFDMDGVLADVSASYHSAIIGTAKFYGATHVGTSDVAAIKAKGGANNDWKVTHALINAAREADSSVQAPSLDDVTAKFEELYQGGLWRTEALLVSKTRLEALARSMPLIIVTGRPYGDAVRFLDMHKITHLFSGMVCMEDTEKPKPDPGPVLLSLERVEGLKGRPTVMIGDTVDDIVAAKAAESDVLPIGVRLPHNSADEQADHADLLMGAGAAGVCSPGCGELLDALLALPPSPLSGAHLGAPPAASVPMAGGAGGAGGAGVAGVVRRATVRRKTKETEIEVTVGLDGPRRVNVDTGVGFFDHMLTAMGHHGRMELEVKCKGDLHIDDHHTVEDVSLAVGEAIDKALGDRKNIRRFAAAHAPLDEALALCVVDVSSRPHSEINMHFTREMIGTVSTEMLTHALESLATAARITLHVNVLTPEANNHHKAECSFKALALAFRQAFSFDHGAGVPSTKGVL